MEDYNQFFKIAQMFTLIHAKPNKKEDKDNDKKNDIYSTPVKKKRKDREIYEIDSESIKKNLSFKDIDLDNKNNSENNINFKNNIKLDMYSLCCIKKNISVSDSKNKKEEIEKWIKRI